MLPAPPPPARRSPLRALLAAALALVTFLLCLVSVWLIYMLVAQPAAEATPTATLAAALFTVAPTTSALPTAVPLPTDLPPTALPTVVPPTAVPPTLTPTPPPATAMPTATPSPMPLNTPPATVPPATVPPLPAFDVPEAIVQTPADQVAAVSLQAFWQNNPPPYDYYEVARGLRYNVGPRTVQADLPQIGAERRFSIDDQRLTAVLAAQGENSSLWLEAGYEIDAGLLAEIAQRIDEVIYPRVRDLFGEEWRPGIDGDPRISLLHVTSVENFAEIGFFNSVNQYPRTLDENSNEQEVLFLNMAELTPGDDLYYATIAHELVHLVQWSHDPNEEVWLDEGLGQLAELVLGYDTAETLDYLNNPQTALTGWAYEDAVVYDHYAASFLFAAYLWEQLGDAAIRDLMAMPRNGLSAVRDLLALYRPQTTLEQFLGEWAAANLLDDQTLDTRYGYATLDPLLPEKVTRIRSAPYETINELAQYGVDYIDLRAGGPLTLTFAGDTTAALLPPPPTGALAWFAPAGADVAPTLTRRFDLSGVTQATLEFSLWYDLEPDYDYGYVQASQDGGQTWQLLRGALMVDGIYGTAYNGQSARAGWVRDSIALDDYADGEVLIRFLMLNDGAYPERGFAVDQIAIPQINYVGDPDGAADGWQADGFLTVGHELPQQWGVWLVQNGVPQPLALDAANRARLALTLSEPATLIVMPQTPGPLDAATYWVAVQADR